MFKGETGNLIVSPLVNPSLYKKKKKKKKKKKRYKIFIQTVKIKNLIYFL